MAGSPTCDHRFVVAKHGYAEGCGWREIFAVLRCAACGAETQRAESRMPWPPVETVTLEAPHGR